MNKGKRVSKRTLKATPATRKGVSVLLSCAQSHVLFLVLDLHVSDNPFAEDVQARKVCA